MISKSLPRVFALAPPGTAGIGIAVAACRANALGILDFGFGGTQDPDDAFAQIRRLTSLPFAIRTRARAIVNASLNPARASFPEVVCVPVWSAQGDVLARAAAAIRQAGRVAIAEATTLLEARLAHSAGFDALILSGHESGGWCGAESSFVLLQGVLAETALPVWVRGGIGPNVAAGCLAAGANGVVLDGALLLSRESPLSPEWRQRIARCDGSETTLIRPLEGVSIRVFAFPGSRAAPRR